MRTNEHNNMDELLRRYVEEAPVPFKDEYWDKMSAVLDEEDKGSKKPFLWRGLSILAIVLTLGLGAYVFPKLKTQTNTHETQHTVKPIQGSLASVQQDVNEANTENTTSETNNTETSGDVAAAPTTSNAGTKRLDQQTNNHTNSLPATEASQPLEHTSDDVAAIENKQPETVKTKSKQKIDIDQAASKVAAEEASKTSKPTTISKNAAASSAVVQTSKPVIAKQTTQTVSTKKADLKRGAAHKVTKADISTQKDMAVSAKTETREHEIAAENAAQSVVNIHGKPMKRIDSSVTVRRDDSRYNPRYMASLSNYIPERLDSITTLRYQPLSSANNEASESNAASNSTTSVVKENTSSSFGPKPFEFFILAGMNMNKGFAGNVVDPIKWGFSPYVGAGVSKAISSKITLASHVGFTYFNGLNTEKKVTNYVYSFGYDSTEFSVQHKKLFEMYLPISLYYQVVRNHYLMASIGGSYAMDVSSSVKNNSQVKAVNQNGYRTGFNAFDVFAGLGYSVQIFRNMMVQLGVQYGFLDRTKNAYFNSTQHNSQTRFSLGVKYSFSRNEP